MAVALRKMPRAAGRFARVVSSSYLIPAQEQADESHPETRHPLPAPLRGADASKTVPALYPESPEFVAMPEVFATGFLVGFLEWACIKAINPHLDWPSILGCASCRRNDMRIGQNLGQVGQDLVKACDSGLPDLHAPVHPPRAEPLRGSGGGPSRGCYRSLSPCSANPCRPDLTPPDEAGCP